MWEVNRVRISGHRSDGLNASTTQVMSRGGSDSDSTYKCDPTTLSLSRALALSLSLTQTLTHLI